MPYPFLKRWMRVSALTKNRSAKRYRCECVALILFASRSADWLASLAAGAERLVPLSVVGEPARACYRRLGIAAMLLPFLPAAAFVQTLADQIGGMAILALVSAVIGSCWLAAIALVLSGNRLAETVLLLLLTVATAGVLAGAGGLSSPLALLAVMPLVESLWVRRDRIALIAGAAASAAALLLQGKIAEMTGLDAAAASAWHWLVPAAYVASLVIRLQGFIAEREEDAAARRPIGAEDVIDAVILKLSRSGDVLDASAKCKTILGLQPGLLLGSGLFDRVHVGDRISYLCALSDLREGAAQRTVEVRLRSPRGSQRRPGRHLCELQARTRQHRRCRSAGCGLPEGERGGRRPAGSVGRSARGGRQGRYRQEPLPGHRQPRAAHPAQRDHRLLRHARPRDVRRFRRSAPEGICRTDPRTRETISLRW